MAKAKKGGTPAGGAKPKGRKRAGAKVPVPDLEPLRGPVEEAKAAVVAAEAEAREMNEKARALVAGATEAYRRALVPYRVACRKAGARCEYGGGRSANVSEKVSFEVERVEKGVRVTVRGRPDTEEVIPLAALEKSINACAYQYAERHCGPREKVGNKGGSLSNRLRAVLR
jgi:hypothetical protein